jgi:hypothetical protein
MNKKYAILILFLIVIPSLVAIVWGQTRRTREEGYLKQTITLPEGQPIYTIIKVCDPDGNKLGDLSQTPSLNGIDKPPLLSVLNKSHPLAKGMAGAWIFNEGSGNIVYDKYGTRNGTIGTAGVWTANGIELDGTINSKIALSSKYLPSQPQIWSVVARFRYDALGDCVVSAAAGQTYAFSVMANEKLYTRVGSDQEILTKATGFFTPPQTHTMVITHNIKVGTWYSDGVQIGTTNTFTGQDLYVWQVDCLTGGTSGQNTLDGVLEFVYLYDRILTAEEVTQIHAKPYSMFFGPLVNASLMTIGSDSLPVGSTLGGTYILPVSEIPDVTNPSNGYSVELQAECLLPTAFWYGANFSWTPSYSQAGNYPSYFHAVDNMGGEDWVIYDWIIQNINRPPKL